MRRDNILNQNTALLELRVGYMSQKTLARSSTSIERISKKKKKKVISKVIRNQ
jgi:hypothetical protein